MNISHVCCTKKHVYADRRQRAISAKIIFSRSPLLALFSIIAISLKVSPTVGIWTYTTGGCDASVYRANSDIFAAQTFGEVLGIDCHYDVQPNCVDDLSDFYHHSYTATCTDLAGQIVTYDEYTDCTASGNTLTLLNKMDCVDFTCALRDFPDPHTHDGEGDSAGCIVTQSNVRVDGGSTTSIKRKTKRYGAGAGAGTVGAGSNNSMARKSSVMPIGVSGEIMLTSITIALVDILFMSIAF